MNRLPLAFAASMLALIACGGEDANLPPPPPPPPPPAVTAPVATVAPPADVDSGAPAAPAGPAITLQEGAASPDPDAKSLPTVKITAPSKDQVIKADKVSDFEIKLDVKNWTTAQGSSHVHLILDNKPYKPVYDPKKPVKISELLNGATLDEGQHVLVAFPSRANHESVKTKGALFVTQFFVGKKPATLPVDLKKPMLVYSRPKGEYNGDMANHVLIDFQLVNDTLAEGKDHVAVTVTGVGIDDKLTANDTKFGTPYYLDNLRNGEYTVKLDLLDKDGNAVPGPWNSTTRKIKVDHDAPTPSMPGMPGMGAADAGAPAATPSK